MGIPRVAIPATLTALLLALASFAGAHDFWLVPEFFLFPEGWSVHVYANTGERFPESMAALGVHRIEKAEVVSPGGRREIAGFRQVGKSLVFEVPRLPPGQHWIAMTVKPNLIELSAESFNEYLAHDGLPQILEERKRLGEDGKAARERYARGAKALVQVGAARDAGAGGEGGEGGAGRALVYDQPVGHTIEFVPVQNPMALTPGEALGVTLLYLGKPLAGMTVSAGYAGRDGHAYTGVTDAQGRVTIPIEGAGRWYVRVIHMIRGREPGIDWESFWATLTFEIPAPETARRP